MERLVADHLRDDPEEPNRKLSSATLRTRRSSRSAFHGREEIGWSARLFPWENALSIITRRYRQRSLVVVRHLDVAKAKNVGVLKGPRRSRWRRSSGRPSPSVIISAAKKRLVKFQIDRDDGNFTDLDTPTQKETEAAVSQRKPECNSPRCLPEHMESQSRAEFSPYRITSPAHELQKREGVVIPTALWIQSALLVTLQWQALCAIACFLCYLLLGDPPRAHGSGLWSTRRDSPHGYPVLSPEAFFGAFDQGSLSRLGFAQSLPESV